MDTKRIYIERIIRRLIEGGERADSNEERTALEADDWLGSVRMLNMVEDEMHRRGLPFEPNPYSPYRRGE